MAKLLDVAERAQAMYYESATGTAAFVCTPYSTKANDYRNAINKRLRSRAAGKALLHAAGDKLVGNQQTIDVKLQRNKFPTN